MYFEHYNLHLARIALTESRLPRLQGNDELLHLGLSKCHSRLANLS
jgi:hypothetical protein